MDEDEAALLAELKAISSRSAVSRFDNNDNDDDDVGNGDPVNEIIAEPVIPSENRREAAKAEVKPPSRANKSMDVPPWKRGKKNAQQKADVDVVAESPKKQSVPPWKRKPKAATANNNNNNRVDVVVSSSPSQPSKANDTMQPKPMGNTTSQNGGNDVLPFTFSGDRGGKANDADLLAELMAISSKGTDRFESSGDGTEEETLPGSVTTSTTTTTSSSLAPPPPPSSAEPNPPVQDTAKPNKPVKERPLPPWKRKKEKTPPVPETNTVDVVLASPVKQTESKAEPTVNAPVGGIKSNLPFTFKGDRGGSAEDEDLLAELRAISSKSSSADRFASNDDGDAARVADEQVENVDPVSQAIPETASKPARKKPEVPPWKRKKAQQPKASDALDVVVSSPPPPPPAAPASNQRQEMPQGAGIKSALPFTFQGDRGGTAEDADLLAELRAISSKSASTDRFAGNEDEEADAVPAEPVVQEPPAKPAKRDTLPPWKRGKAKKQEDSDDVVVATPPSNAGKSRNNGSGRGSNELPPWKRKPKQSIKQEKVQTEVVAPAQDDPAVPMEENLGIKSDLPFTFKGDRGGAAEDADLLAELRAISGNGSRFAPADEGPQEAPASSQAVNNEAPPPKPENLPPWKRKSARSNKAATNAEPDPPAAPVMPAKGLTSNLPFTFKGDRGGAAEDADLLAELKAISSGSANNSRFADNADSDAGGQPSGGSSASEIASPPPVAIKTDLPFTFKGDRGGAANDADLLAELQSISARSSQPRPAGQKGNGARSTPKPSSGFDPLSPPNLSSSQPRTPASPMSPMSGEPPQDEVVVTRDMLPSSVKDKNWKVRKQSYVLLREILSETLGNAQPGTVTSGSIMDGLEEAVVAMSSDSNANALDTALLFVLDYADACAEASDAEFASAITFSLLKGNGFSSSKVTTVRSAGAIARKLMEVGGDGASSVHGVVNAILEKGVTSKKPKLVLNAAKTILEASLDFGAANLPLAAIKTSAPKMLSHSNPGVRETTMKILAEMCRSLGSKAPLQDLLDTLKKAQISQLDAMLESQKEPSPVRVGLRNSASGTDSSGDALAALEAQSKELAAQRFASRPAVNIYQALPRTGYSTRIVLPKWSEKVGALDILLECGGEKPYKLAQPSSSVNYASTIADMKKLLAHTHFAVCSKAMAVLSMLAEGVGEKLYPYLRPLLTTLAQLSKDKKLTNPVASCLDVMFGNVLAIEHLMNKEDALPSQLDEKKQKNALVRQSLLEYLSRCVERRDTAGKRGNVSVKAMESVAKLLSSKLGDTNANVRKAATNALKACLAVDDEDLVSATDRVVETLSQTNARAYKSLKSSKPSKSNGTPAAKSKAASVSSPARPAAAQDEAKSQISVKATPIKPAKVKESKPAGNSEKEPMSIDAAIDCLSSIGIPNWEGAEEDGGILEGMQSTKWQSRQGAIQVLSNFCESESFTAADTATETAVIVFVKTHTKGFKESNFNVARAIMELLIALCSNHLAEAVQFPSWATKDGVRLAIEKVADKKLASSSKELLTCLLSVQHPSQLLPSAFAQLDGIRSPVAHESFLIWFKGAIDDFGARILASELNEIIQFLSKESTNSNIKVKKASLAVVGDLHAQLGPAFRALSLSMCSDASKGQFESACDEHTFDPSLAKMERARTNIVFGEGSGDDGDDAVAAIEIPKTDLVGIVGKACIEKMGSKEGKTAWKMRKAALDDVEVGLKGCSGLLSTTPPHLKSLVELLRALRERLSDSQSNLKPVAARIIGDILGSVDKAAQARLGKLVYSPLLAAAMNDNRKPMREASLAAVRKGTQEPELDGGKPNELALEAMLVAFVGELSESEFKAGGLPDVLQFVTSVSSSLPNVDSIVAARGQQLGDKFASVLVDCLTSSKSETRNAAEQLIKACLDADAISSKTVRKGLEHLKPAQQRTVCPIIIRLTGTDDMPSSQSEKGNGPSKRDKGSGVSVKAEPSPRRVARGKGPARSASTRAFPKKSEQAEEDGGHEGTDMHPLESTSGAKFPKEKAVKQISWTEYPEEPGPAQLASLKRAWTNLLPSKSTEKLFPATGIRKQEDAKSGCEVLSRAIEWDTREGTTVVMEQLDLVLRWACLVLCSRESTVGLQVLLSFFLRLVAYLGGCRYTLGDDEANLLFPYIVEKASIAKGRFKDTFHELLTNAKELEVVSQKSMGAVVCVSVIERTSQPKARVLAYHEVRACVESVGLSGLGKKGLLSVCKRISSENTAENKGAVLDLMMTVLTKMNGDVDRLARICGTSNLSDKSKKLIEERWNKRAQGGTGKAAEDVNSPRSGRSSGLPGSARRSQLSGLRKPATTTGRKSEVKPRASGDAMDQLRTLELKLGTTSVSASAPRPSALPTQGPFTFSFESKGSSASADDEGPSALLGGVSSPPKAPKAAEPVVTKPTIATGVSSSPTASTGAAASLRARLLKIREKHRQQEESEKPPDQPPTSSANETGAPRLAPFDEQFAESVVTKKDEEPVEEEYYMAIAKFDSLTQLEGPIEEDDAVVLDCIAQLKRFHTALSKSLEFDINPDLATLRADICREASETVEHLNSLVNFAFNNGQRSQNAGMSVPLLSVVLATLMALFRDNEAAENVSQDDLALLLRETGRCLLDSRLAVTATHASGLDESTSSQIVRGMNKLAVQAATGTPRHISLQALMTLQQQLTLTEADSPSEAALSARLSRIVTKLFGKVMKAEEADSHPFSSDVVDLQSLLCAVEDMLVAVESSDSDATVCPDMARTVMSSVVDKGGYAVYELQDQMEQLGIHPRDSALAELLADVAPPLEGMDRSFEVSNRGKSEKAADVATLVSAVGSASGAAQREAAVEELRKFRAVHGDNELDSYLGQVSATFRVYIENQLNAKPVSPQRSTSKDPMTERIRSLRKKLDEAESSFEAEADTKSNSPASVSGIPRPGSRPSSPTKTSSAAMNLRQRLAAAQENRSHSSRNVTASTSHDSKASALRARLQAVRKQTKGNS